MIFVHAEKVGKTMRLIDADAYADKMREKQKECKELINEAGDNLSDRNYWKGIFLTFVEAKLTLDNTPTVDAVPVVRCKDCKHYKDGRCFFTMRRYGLYDDWFCADGERREDNDE